jgi:hypothetical protein
MQSRIDWLSFTLPVENEYAPHRGVHKIQDTLAGAGLNHVLALYSGNWVQDRGRSPYALSLSHQGVVIYAGKPSTILIEIQGEGCFRLGLPIEGLLKRFSQRVTRIDLASDMTCNTDPETFVEYADKQRMRTSAVIRSDTGTTVYIGSRKSERYARVYRYSEPHPRASDLRCEMVFRGKYAKAVADFVARNGVQAAIVAYGDTYGWKHPEWTPETLESPLEAQIPLIRKSQNGTVRWLIAQAAPAFRKCVDSGSIDNPEDFLRQYFLGKERRK